MAGEFYPFYAEEWVNMVVGLATGVSNYLLLHDRTCKVVVFDAALSAAVTLRGDYDESYPTGIGSIIFSILGYIQVLFKIYNAVMGCILESKYLAVRSKWEGFANAMAFAAEEEPMMEETEDVFIEEEDFDEFMADI